MILDSLYFGLQHENDCGDLNFDCKHNAFILLLKDKKFRPDIQISSTCKLKSLLDLKNIYEAFKTVSEWGTLAFKMNRYVNWFQEEFYYFNHGHIYKLTDSRKL